MIRPTLDAAKATRVGHAAWRAILYCSIGLALCEALDKIEMFRAALTDEPEAAGDPTPHVAEDQAEVGDG